MNVQEGLGHPNSRFLTLPDPWLLIKINLAVKSFKNARQMVEETHFGDPRLPECWPLLPLIYRLPVSPAQITAWACFRPLARNINRSDLALKASLRPRSTFYRSDSSAQPTCFLWLLQIFALFSMCPSSSNSCIASNTLPSFIHMFLH